MKPNFALDLSEDGIVLLHRHGSGDGWLREGRVNFADDDIAEGLAALRERAIELDGETFQTKLILPHSQLLFTTVETGADIAALLEERTPYRADQLSYDSYVDGDQTHVIAVALQTLGEAEGFISPHGLNPVGFTAIPKEPGFAKEPMLGGVLAGSDGFAPDARPIEVMTAPPKNTPKAVQVEAENGAPDSKDEAEAVTAADKPPDEIKPDTPAPKPAAKAPKTDAKDVTAEEAPAAASSGAAPAAFSSRRRSGEAGDGEQTKSRLTQLSARIAVPENAPKLGSAPPRGPSETARPKDKSTKPAKKEPILKPRKTAKPAPIVPPVAAPIAAAPAARAGSTSAIPSAARRKSAPPEKVAKHLAKADPLADLAKADRRGKPKYLGVILTAILIAFLGIAALLSSYILPENTVSSLFGRDTPDVVELDPITTEPEQESDTDLLAEPEPELGFDEEIELARLPIDQTLPEFGDEEELGLDEEPDPFATRAFEDMTEDEAEAAYAASGIWQRMAELPPLDLEAQTLENLYVASLDPDPGFEDAPALIIEATETPEAELVAFTRPPPAGVIFDLDERGLVRPTPEGALTPEGAMVYLGRPPVDAIPRPGADPVPEAEETPLAEAESDTATDDAPPAVLSAEQQRLAGIRPLPRPGDLSERRERAELGGLTRAELAAIRPIQRPASAQAQAEAIARALLEADAGNSDADIEAALAAATPRAVSASQRARPRPRNFSRIVQAARRATQSRDSAVVQTASASTAAAAPRASGPAVARSSRANPTGRVSARVARAATDNNAIALGRVSLVGVFGTSSNRRALVRMPNGRFKKVSVGDRVDGGRVAAISSSSLRYTKGGRTVTLEMPNG